MSPTQSIRRYSEKYPEEIRLAIEGIDGETEQAILVLLFDEERLAFTQLQRKLGDEDPLHPEKLSNALDNLKRGGLVRKKINDSNPEQGGSEKNFSSYYLISEYGRRFTQSLFDSLHNPEERRRRPTTSQQRKNTIRNSEMGEERISGTGGA